MSRRTRIGLRLARLVALCLAIFVARPAAAAVASDPIVLVAELVSARATDGTPADAAEKGDVPRRSAPPVHPNIGEDTACAPTTETPLVLVREKYLRNCALLR